MSPARQRTLPRLYYALKNAGDVSGSVLSLVADLAKGVREARKD